MVFLFSYYQSWKEVTPFWKGLNRETKMRNKMQTILVEVNDNVGLRILQELEQAHIIRLIQPPLEKIPKKLSTRLRGSFSKETAKQMKSELEQIFCNEY
jgi:hypothetical protein